MTFSLFMDDYGLFSPAYLHLVCARVMLCFARSALLACVAVRCVLYLCVCTYIFDDSYKPLLCVYCATT